MSEVKLKHLEMIQGVVNRIAANSFSIKGWSVLLVSALFALGASDTQPAFVVVAYFPAIAFWILDGYFLWQEKLFRKHYDRVRELADGEVDFSMEVKDLVHEVDSQAKVTLSKTLRLFHGAILATVILVTVILVVVDHADAGTEVAKECVRCLEKWCLHLLR